MLNIFIGLIAWGLFGTTAVTQAAPALDPLSGVSIDEEELKLKISQDIRDMTPEQLKQTVINLMLIITQKDLHSAGASPNSMHLRMLFTVENIAKTIQWSDVYRKLRSLSPSPYVAIRVLHNYCLGYGDISKYYIENLSAEDLINRYHTIRRNQTPIEAYAYAAGINTTSLYAGNAFNWDTSCVSRFPEISTSPSKLRIKMYDSDWVVDDMK